jgi:hypothetical protein
MSIETGIPHAQARNLFPLFVTWITSKWRASLL